ncbi:hypothetical protein C4588_04695 [Candidatus Parcubacteria bacterium]|nr:MAG: hypothetical protein C4588_04695 [Candidatus Parcubacteria bacterium]
MLFHVIQAGPAGFQRITGSSKLLLLYPPKEGLSIAEGKSGGADLDVCFGFQPLIGTGLQGVLPNWV